ncbi:MAG TPA: hypothetical protein VGK62_07205 [Gaiellaceae bacterium]
MRHLKHPATIVAAVALFVAFGGGAAAYATGLIPGSQIKNHSIAAKKLTRKAIRSLHGRRGAQGPAGPAGAPGARGPAGPTGPQGPGGKIATYDATASASPTVKTLGTFLGDTIGAACSIPAAGQAEVTLYLKTTDGSWRVDDSIAESDNDGASTSAGAGYADVPAGTFSSLVPFLADTANAGGFISHVQLHFIQIRPVAGSAIWHYTASTKDGAQTCHLSVEAIPETITTVAGTPRASSRTISQARHQLGLPSRDGA